MRKILIGVTVVVLVLVAGAVALGRMMMRVEVALPPDGAPGAQVQPVRVGHSNVHLIRGAGGTVLVDTGMPGSPEALDEVFAVTGTDPGPIRWPRPSPR